MSGSFLVARLCTLLLLVGLAQIALPQTLANPWLEAVSEQDLVALSQLLEDGPVNPNLALPDGRTALMIAARRADAELVAQLLAAGANVNASTANGGTVLMFAAIGGDAGITGLLLDAGARHDVKASLGWTALGLAAVKGHAEVARTLLDAGADPDSRDAYGWTPLMRAVHQRHDRVVRLLLETPDVDLSLAQETGATVLHIAAADGDPDIIELLLAAGAGTAARDGEGRTAADIAMAVGHFDIAAMLRSLEAPTGED